MYALTLRHPWAYAICSLGKDVENRTFRPDVLKPGDWFVIHGGVAPASMPKLRAAVAQAEALRRRFRPGDTSLIPWRSFILEGAVAVARFDGAVTAGEPGSESPWFEGPIGWKLGSVFVLPEPIACRGAQGLWTVPDTVYRQIRTEWVKARGRGAKA